jgi:hypothetical protein
MQTTQPQQFHELVGRQTDRDGFDIFSDCRSPVFGIADRRDNELRYRQPRRRVADRRLCR